MKNNLLIALLLAFATACGSGNAAALPEAEQTPTPTPAIAQTKGQSVPFVLAYYGALSDKVKTRKWSVADGVLSVDADLTGDGRLEHAEFVFAPSKEVGSFAVMSEKEGKYVITWDGNLKNVSVGDVDSDGDADIILDAGKKLVLMNTSPKFDRPPMTDEAFKAKLADIAALVSQGKALDAYHAAFDIALGTPHSFLPAGEGPSGRYDRDPEFDPNIGNCIVWVENIMAMLNSGGSYDRFISELEKIRYKDGDVDYVKRNHFQEVDWIPNNIAAGYIEDLLPSLLGEAEPFIEGRINKRNWYAAKTVLEGNFDELSAAEKSARLAELRKQGESLPEQHAKLGYYPIEKMLVKNGDSYTLDQSFVDALPEVTIFNVVNKGRAVKDANGSWITDLIVTHVGFIVKEADGQALVYHSTNKTDASLLIMAQEKLLSFLEHRFAGNTETTVVGLHLSRPIIKEVGSN